jgi:hypothetical protein
LVDQGAELNGRLEPAGVPPFGYDARVRMDGDPPQGRSVQGPVTAGGTDPSAGRRAVISLEE